MMDQGKAGYVDRQTIKQKRVKEVFCSVERQAEIDRAKLDFFSRGGKVSLVKTKDKNEVFQELKPRFKKLMKNVLKNKTSVEKRRDLDD